MTRTELSQKSKYYIPANLYKQCVYFCRQYPEWALELRTDTQVKGIDYQKEKVQTGGGQDQTQTAALRRYEVARKKKLVDDTIAEAVPEDLREWLLIGVTTDCTIWELLERGLPVSHNTFYKYRRAFFYSLSKKL